MSPLLSFCSFAEEGASKEVTVLGKKYDRLDLGKENSARLSSYKMDPTKRFRGRAIILNVETFQEDTLAKGSGPLPSRKGSEKDVAVMADLFKWLQFDVIVEKDCQENLYDVMKELLTDEDHNYQNDDCFACVLMSHGYDNCLSSSSGPPVQLDNIFELTSNHSFCPGLCGREVPKLFFIQACRQYRKPDLDGQPCDSPDCPPEADFAGKVTSKCQVPSDFLFSFATRPGCPAYRYPQRGTPYIKHLNQALRDHVPEGKDLLSILTEVSQRVKEDSKDYPQSCEHRNQLHHQVVFPWLPRYTV